MQRAIVTVSYCILEQALHLPAEHRIIGIRLVDTFSDTFEICVEGPSLAAVPEKGVTPRALYTVTVSENRDDLVPSRTYVGKFS